jgi:hypothetical protein
LRAFLRGCGRCCVLARFFSLRQVSVALRIIFVLRA